MTRWLDDAPDIDRRVSVCDPGKPAIELHRPRQRPGGLRRASVGMIVRENAAHRDIGDLAAPVQGIELQSRAHAGSHTWFIWQGHAHFVNPPLSHGDGFPRQSSRHLAEKRSDFVALRARAELDAPIGGDAYLDRTRRRWLFESLPPRTVGCHHGVSDSQYLGGVTRRTAHDRAAEYLHPCRHLTDIRTIRWKHLRAVSKRLGLAAAAEWHPGHCYLMLESHAQRVAHVRPDLQ